MTMQKEDLAENMPFFIADESQPPNSPTKQQTSEEIGGIKSPEPTRYGDWEKNGRCVDF